MSSLISSFAATSCDTKSLRGVSLSCNATSAFPFVVRRPPSFSPHLRHRYHVPVKEDGTVEIREEEGERERDTHTHRDRQTETEKEEEEERERERERETDDRGRRRREREREGWCGVVCFSAKSSAVSVLYRYVYNMYTTRAAPHASGNR